MCRYFELGLKTKLKHFPFVKVQHRLLAVGLSRPCQPAGRLKDTFSVSTTTSETQKQQEVEMYTAGILRLAGPADKIHPLKRSCYLESPAFSVSWPFQSVRLVPDGSGLVGRNQRSYDLIPDR